jgi:hypothetical protein
MYEGCPPRCDHGAVPDDYGCPGYVPVHLKPPTGEGSKELLADRAVSLITSKCDTSSLVGGLTTDLEATLSVATSPIDHQAAQEMLREVSDIAAADQRMKNFHDNWMRSGPSDADLTKKAVSDIVAALISGNFRAAEKRAVEASLTPTILGRSDFPVWYPASQFLADRTAMEKLSLLRGRVWELVRRTNPAYRQ